MELTTINNLGINTTPTTQNPPKSQENKVEMDAIKTSTELLNQVKLQPEYIPTLQEKTIIHTIEEANKKLVGSEREFEFSVHEKTKQIVVRIIDKATKDIIREIPSEKILDMVASMCEMNGLLIDEKR